MVFLPPPAQQPWMAVVFKQMKHFKAHADYVFDDEPHYETWEAYLMTQYPMAMADDYKFCKTKLSIISPVLKFMEQLSSTRWSWPAQQPLGQPQPLTFLSCGLNLTMSAKALLMAFLPPPAQQPGMAVVFWKNGTFQLLSTTTLQKNISQIFFRWA